MEYLGIPVAITAGFVAIFLVIQIIGELLEFKGKIVPEFFKIRKYFARKKEEHEIIKKLPETMDEIKTMFNDFNAHYSEDNIAKRNQWIESVDKRLDRNDEVIQNLSEKLDRNNEDTLDILIDNKRNAIIDFASKITRKDEPVTRERFNRIFKIYQEYENLIKENGRTNGEVTIAYRIINESYEEHMRNHTFIEDIRGWE